MLALELGRTVSELMTGEQGPLLAAEELSWMAYYKIAPFGDYRADIRSAQVAQLIFNANSKKPRKLEDFMLFNPRKAVVEQERGLAKKVRSSFNAWIAAHPPKK